MGMTSWWWDKTMGKREAGHSPAGNAGGKSTPSASQPAASYSLQGEEDLFRDPFADFAPSSR